MPRIFCNWLLLNSVIVKVLTLLDQSPYLRKPKLTVAVLGEETSNQNIFHKAKHTKEVLMISGLEYSDITKAET